MFEDLKKNIEQEKKIVADMSSVNVSMYTDAEHYSFYLSSLNALSHQLRILNRAVPELLKEWSPIRKLVEKNEAEKQASREEFKKDSKVIQKIKEVMPSIGEKSKTIKMSYISPSNNEKKLVVINKGDKEEFLKKLSLSENNVGKIKKIKEKMQKAEFKGPSFFAKTSNKFFRNVSDGLVQKFSGLSGDMKKGNMSTLTSTYISMGILASIIGLSIGVLVFGGLIVLSASNWTYGWMPVLIVGLVMSGFYFYPVIRANTVQGKVAQELPFATIHMAAIAGSNMEPTKILRIVASSNEYPNFGAEVRKVITQVNVYGYDVVTSLKNVASKISSKKLAELFSGIATNISTGGELKNYLEKKAENFLIDYRLERQKYADLAGTFMDVYISILIAAPLILMMMFIIMNVVGLGGGIGINKILLISIVGIVLVNIAFLFVLKLKQPQV